MNENEKKYIKLNPEKNVFPKQRKMFFSERISNESVIENVPIIFQKPSKEIQAKAFFVIISGGEVREKDYFRIVSQQDKFNRIKIEFIADSNRLSPKGMFEIALYKKEHFISSQDTNNDMPDKIFLISDVDEYMPELLDIKPECITNNLHLIISNSCIEVWLYYAYCSEIPNFKIPERIETISWEFKRWVPKVIKGGINPVKAVFNIHQNIFNAKRNYNEDKNGIPTLFSSNMFELSEELLPLIETELLKLIEENNIREASFRNTKKKDAK